MTTLLLASSLCGNTLRPGCGATTRADKRHPRKYLAGVDRSGRGFNPRPAQTGSGILVNLCALTLAFAYVNASAPFSNLKDPRKCLAGVDRSGRGFNPRPAQTGSGILVNLCALMLAFVYVNASAPFPNLKDPRKCLAGVDRSGRGFNPRPAQGDDKGGLGARGRGVGAGECWGCGGEEED